MEVVLGAALLTGQVQRVVPMQGRPSLDIRLDGDHVDLDAIRAIAGLIVGEGDGNRMAGHDIGARLSAERFEAPGMAAGGTDLSVRLKGGTLDIDRLTVTDVAGVSLSGVGRVENVFDGPEGEVDVSVMAERTGEIVALLSRLPAKKKWRIHHAAAEEKIELHDQRRRHGDLRSGISRQMSGVDWRCRNRRFRAMRVLYKLMRVNAS